MDGLSGAHTAREGKMERLLKEFSADNIFEMDATTAREKLERLLHQARQIMGMIPASAPASL
jgi:arginine/lysine/ornithine decarboxylase